jgi:CHASE1-domain containing sensor protein
MVARQSKLLNDPKQWVHLFMLGDWTPTILTVICGILVSIGGFALVYQYQRSIEQRAFAAEVGREADALNEGIKRYADVVNAVATFVTASDRINRWEFLRFADLTLRRYSGFSALEPFREVSNHDEGAVNRRSMRRIMARRMKATALRA